MDTDVSLWEGVVRRLTLLEDPIPLYEGVFAIIDILIFKV